jgi:ataxia telangiectasia mutated family protein
MDSYLESDPNEVVWSMNSEGVEQSDVTLPSQMIPRLGADDDIRIRLKMAAINARFLSSAQSEDAVELYGRFKEPLSKDVGKCVFTSFFVLLCLSVI